ncbi:aminoglycoside phosphotransferase [Streptomyces sp. W007]|nr:aminoglycoside phosphotransferase [Streptomyces sp. W007]
MTVSCRAGIATPRTRRASGIEVATGDAGCGGGWRLVGGTVDHGPWTMGGQGQPEGFPERQVPRWTAESEGYAIALGLLQRDLRFQVAGTA